MDTYLQGRKMGKFRLAGLVLFVTLIATGCAAPIRYGFDKNLYRRAEPKSLTAVVDLFQDLRMEDERDGTFSATKRYLYTKDKLFKKNIDRQVSDALVKHLQKARMFEEVAFQDFDDDLFESPEKMAALKAQGFDVAIQGDLYHFYGYRSGAGAAAFFGLAGILTEALVNHKVVGGRAAYGEVKFVDLNSASSVWQGNFSYDYEDRVVFYGEPPSYAIQALKEINDQLTKKLDEVVDEL